MNLHIIWGMVKSHFTVLPALIILMVKYFGYHFSIHFEEESFSKQWKRRTWTMSINYSARTLKHFQGKDGATLTVIKVWFITGEIIFGNGPKSLLLQNCIFYFLTNLHFASNTKSVIKIMIFFCQNGVFYQPHSWMNVTPPTESVFRSLPESYEVDARL